MKSIDVMIAEDYLLYRTGIVETLSELPGIRVSGEATNGRELLSLAEEAVPDVVLMDIRMPEMNGIDATAALLERHPAVGVIALTVHEDEWYVAQMVLAGARGYLYKESTEAVLAKAIEEVYGGGFYYCSTSQLRLTALLKQWMPDGRTPEKTGVVLNNEEIAFIRLTCDGYLAKEIADRLDISIDKAKRYRHVLVYKTGSRNWAGVVRYALRHQLL